MNASTRDLFKSQGLLILKGLNEAWSYLEVIPHGYITNKWYKLYKISSFIYDAIPNEEWYSYYDANILLFTRWSCYKWLHCRALRFGS